MTVFNPLQYRSYLSVLSPPAHVSAWQEHIPFGMALIEMLRPRVLVELGVHQGGSYLSFCHAVATLGLSCRCYGVDTFQGDGHTGGYGSEVENDLRLRHDPLYAGFSNIIRATFDEAAASMSDGFIDLLHIDGFHTYEAVAHDFATWLPKLSDRGVVLFHDINVRERGFGVWRFWDEVRAKYPHAAFMHGYGLGILAVGRDVPAELAPLLALDGEAAARVGELFFLLGNRLTLQLQIDQLKQIINNLGGQNAALENVRTEQEKQIQSLQKTVKDQQDTLAVLQNENTELRNSLQQITQSLSFRLGMGATGPLRWVAGRLGNS